MIVKVRQGGVPAIKLISAQPIELDTEFEFETFLHKKDEIISE